MFYYFMYSDAAAKGFAQTSQMFLNGLVKELEFYKLKNGSYPDSLEQLPRNHDIFSIYDPLLSRRSGIKDTKYNYGKTGDTYILGCDNLKCAHTPRLKALTPKSSKFVT